MNFSEIIIITLGLVFFEIVSSIDNAVVNADVLHTMSKKARRWFLSWGMLISVFLVRGALPLIIVYCTNPVLGLVNVFGATFSQDSAVREAMEKSTPILIAGGGIYLLLLFFHWFFREPKQYAFPLERHVHASYSLWFYSVAALILLAEAWLTIRIDPFITLGAVVGSTVFFITHGFKTNAEEKERELRSGSVSDWSKVLYLEVIDAAFSIDGVVGAFAFTVSVPLIIIGNGIGAFAVRYFTMRGISVVKKYWYLKNGAMYSIGFLGAFMMAESLGAHIPSWVPPLVTVCAVGFFFWLSKKHLNNITLKSIS